VSPVQSGIGETDGPGRRGGKDDFFPFQSSANGGRGKANSSYHYYYWKLRGGERNERGGGGEH